MKGCVVLPSNDFLRLHVPHSLSTVLVLFLLYYSCHLYDRLEGYYLCYLRLRLLRPRLRLRFRLRLSVDSDVTDRSSVRGDGGGEDPFGGSAGERLRAKTGPGGWVGEYEHLKGFLLVEQPLSSLVALRRIHSLSALVFPFLFAHYTVQLQKISQIKSTPSVLWLPRLFLLRLKTFRF